MDLKRLTELLSYDPSTGVFTWNVSAGKGIAGKVAGCVRRHSKSSHYLTLDIGIDGKTYRAHRLAWMYVHGEFPDVEIDHIDGDGLNNRIANLRLATHKQNGENTKIRTDNKTGFRGVSFHKQSQLWRARVSHHGVEHTKYFEDFDTAVTAAIMMRNNLYSHYVGRE